MNCDEARYALALGLDEDAKPHLRDCDACRLEAARIAPLMGALAESAEVEPPATLDARVRRSLKGWRPLPSLVTASGLAIAAYASMIFGVGIWLASSGLAEATPAVMAAIAVCYLAACSAATLPLLIRRARPRPAVLQEVRS